MPAAPTDLVLTGLGMISSVGHDVVTACAAIRAGMARPAPLVGMGLLDLESGELVPVIGHPIRGATDGFYMVGRWVRLAQEAVEDLLRGAQLPPADARDFWQGCHLILVTPTLQPERF